MTAKSPTAQRVVDAIIENRRRFEDFCYSLTEEELMRPVPGTTWIVRDFPAHLDTLDTALLRWFAGAANGVPVDSSRSAAGDPFDVDAFNDAQVAARRDWPLDQVFAEARQNRRKLIDTISVLTEEQIEQPMHFAGDAKRNAGDLALKLFLAGWAQHDPIHVADMIKALPERAADPEIVAWLNNPFVSGYQAAMTAPAKNN
jgi:hypothetical protein